MTCTKLITKTARNPTVKSTSAGTSGKTRKSKVKSPRPRSFGPGLNERTHRMEKWIVPLVLAVGAYLLLGQYVAPLLN